MQTLPETYASHLPPLPDHNRRSGYEASDSDKSYRYHPLAGVPPEMFPEPMALTVDIFQMEL